MDEFPENVETVEKPDTAKQPRRRGPGRPFTPETSRAVQMSATAAKKARRDTRHKMLAALTQDLDLRQELLKALRERDEQYLNMIEKATKLVGLQWEQSDEGREQRFKVDAKADVNAKLQAPSINITFKDAEPKA